MPRSRTPNARTLSERKKSVLYVLLWTSSFLTECQAFLIGRERKSLSSPRGNNDGTKAIVASAIPETNPYADQDAYSLAGVRYGSVLSGLHSLFPPDQLESRNALSRSDGYWSYIQKGEEPPQALTYGEFDFYFFADLLDRACSHFDDDGSTTTGWDDKVFVDIGSGTGRLVFAAAALHNWRQCRGVELLQGISDAADENLEKCLGADQRYALTTEDEYGGERIPMAPVELLCGSFEDPCVYFGDADCVFVYSSAMGPQVMAGLAKAVGRQCKPGTLVITTDYMLPLEGTVDPDESDSWIPSGTYQLELMEKVEGWCWGTGGTSTAFIHRVSQSLWEEGNRQLESSKVSSEDQVFKATQDLEAFLRNM